MNSHTVIRVEHLGKEYRLGTINHGTLRRDLQSWWARIRGKPDPNALIRDDEWLSQSGPEVDNNGETPKAADSHARRDRFLALDDVSFDVQEGETFGIIGKNGAGKSTLLKILCRITAPSAGRATIRGRIASLLEVGTGFHPELTGCENVFLNGAILGMSRDEIRRKFDDIVAFSQLERFIDTPVKRYSSGMYVRLAFSVAAHLDAEVLIVDEVLAVGDYEFQKKCMEKLREVTAKGRTVLLVSHNLSAVQNLCKRSILLQRGRIEAAGVTEKVVEVYVAKSRASASAVPLAQREDRNGSGVFRFVEVRVEADNATGSTLIKSGSDTVINILLENRHTHTLREVDISLGMDNYVGDRIAILTTNAVAATLAELPPGRTLVEFCIPKLPFVPGSYYFTLFGTAGGQVADWVESAASFDVVVGDFFGTGRAMPPGQGSILIPYAVETKSNSSPARRFKSTN